MWFFSEISLFGASKWCSCILKVKSLIEYVKKGFKNYLLHKIWIDEKTRHSAEEKVGIELSYNCLAIEKRHSYPVMGKYDFCLKLSAKMQSSLFLCNLCSMRIGLIQYKPYMEIYGLMRRAYRNIHISKKEDLWELAELLIVTSVHLCMRI